MGERTSETGLFVKFICDEQSGQRLKIRFRTLG